jgi:hypothetical protein
LSKEAHKRKLRREKMRRYRAKKKREGYRLAWVKEPPKYSPTIQKIKMKKLWRKKKK